MNDLLRASDVAPRLGLSTSRTYALMQSGYLPIVRRGRIVRVPRAAFDAWLEMQNAVSVASVEPVPVKPTPVKVQEPEETQRLERAEARVQELERAIRRVILTGSRWQRHSGNATHFNSLWQAIEQARATLAEEAS